MACRNGLDKNNISKECQSGFRKDYSTVDNVFNSSNIIQLRLRGDEIRFTLFSLVSGQRLIAWRD